jgi:hypothetical protein
MRILLFCTCCVLSKVMVENGLILIVEFPVWRQVNRKEDCELRWACLNGDENATIIALYYFCVLGYYHGFRSCLQQTRFSQNINPVNSVTKWWKLGLCFWIKWKLFIRKKIAVLVKKTAYLHLLIACYGCHAFDLGGWKILALENSICRVQEQIVLQKTLSMIYNFASLLRQCLNSIPFNFLKSFLRPQDKQMGLWFIICKDLQLQLCI